MNTGGKDGCDDPGNGAEPSGFPLPGSGGALRSRDRAPRRNVGSERIKFGVLADPKPCRGCGFPCQTTKVGGRIPMHPGCDRLDLGKTRMLSTIYAALKVLTTELHVEFIADPAPTELEMGPCGRCRKQTHRYGMCGRVLCDECQPVMVRIGVLDDDEGGSRLMTAAVEPDGFDETIEPTDIPPLEPAPDKPDDDEPGDELPPDNEPAENEPDNDDVPANDAGPPLIE